MAHDGILPQQIVSMVTAEQIATNLIVAASATAGKAAVCGSGGTPIGVVMELFASGATAAVYRKGRLLCTSTAAINAGEFVKPGASGKIAPEGTVTTRTADTCGVADSTVGAGDALIYIWFD
jgi:hypothetical protein